MAKELNGKVLCDALEGQCLGKGKQGTTNLLSVKGKSVGKLERERLSYLKERGKRLKGLKRQRVDKTETQAKIRGW